MLEPYITFVYLDSTVNATLIYLAHIDLPVYPIKSNASLVINGSAIHCPIFDVDENTHATIQDSVVQMITDQVRINGSTLVKLINNKMEGDYYNKSFTLKGNVSYAKRQPWVLGVNKSRVAIESSQVYAVGATWESQINLSNSLVYDLLAVGDLGRIEGRNTTICGAGLATGRGTNDENNYYGTVGNPFGGYFAAPEGSYPVPAPLLVLTNCTILGRVCRWNVHIIVMQDSLYNQTITNGFCYYFLLLHRDDVAVQLSGWGGGPPNAEPVTHADLTINNMTIIPDATDPLQFSLDPVNYTQLVAKGVAAVDIIAYYNGTKNFTANFMFEFPSDALQKVDWTSWSEFIQYEASNCTIWDANVSLGVDNIAYDFHDDPVGAEPEGWVVSEAPNTHCQVVANRTDHSQVVEFWDNDYQGYAKMEDDNIPDQTNGSIEFWMYGIEGILDMESFLLLGYSGDTIAFVCHAWYCGQKWLINDRGNNNYDRIIWPPDFAFNTWWHIRLDFFCGNDTIRYHVNGADKGSYAFWSPVENISKIIIRTETVPYGNYYGYIDAIDYSWSAGYFINRSLLHYGDKYWGQDYYNCGLWSSEVMDLETPSPYLQTLLFSHTTPANTSLTGGYRTNANASVLQEDPEGQTAQWSAWSSSNLTINAYGKRYFQVRTLLTTDNVSLTPTLHWINLSYLYNYPAGYNSSNPGEEFMEGLDTQMVWNTTEAYRTSPLNNCTSEANTLTLGNNPQETIFFDFTADALGATPKNWKITEPANTVLEVQAAKANHSKVVRLELINADVGQYALMRNNFKGQTNATIEFWLYLHEIPEGNAGLAPPMFYLGMGAQDTLGICLGFQRNGSAIKYALGGDLKWHPTGATWVPDTWQYYRIDFDCTSDTYQLYQDHVVISELAFVHNQDSLTYLALGFGWAQSTHMNGSAWVDALDYSWSAGYFTNRSYSYYGQTRYQETGIWESSIVELEVPTSYLGQISFRGETTENTTIHLSYRTSGNASLQEDEGWSAWTAEPIVFEGCKDHYFQVRVWLYTANELQTRSSTIFQ